jgi:microcystin-dependent protein
MSSDLPVVAPVSELSHKTVIIYLCIFLLVVGGIAAALYFLVFKKKSCKTDNDCKTGEFCHDGKCYKIDPSTKCKSDNECGNNQVCDNGKCVTKPSQKQCQQDEDCGNAQCINNKCVFANFIVAFDTADLPDGWVECDGNNGTPDIQGKFIKGCDEKDLDFGKTKGNSSHMLTLAETYHEHVIPAQSLGTNVYSQDPSSTKGVSCFWSYSDIGQYNVPKSTKTMDNQTSSQPTLIDLTPTCTSVIFATPLNNATNTFPIGTIIWLYDLGTKKKPSLSGSDWTYYGTSDIFFIGRDDSHELGKTFGNNKITLKQSDIPDHTHSFQYPLVPDFNNNCTETSNPPNGTVSCPDGNIFSTDPTIQGFIQTPSFPTLKDPSISSFDILPSYQPLFCIKKTSSNINDIPIGSICAWNSLAIPKGWLICDGKDSTTPTPDLTSKFILNKDSNSDQLGDIGGHDSVTLHSDHIAPTHTHTYSFQQYKSTHNLCDGTGNSSGNTVSDCRSGQDFNNNFPITGMCDVNGANCMCGVGNPGCTTPYTNTPIPLDPSHIKLIYIMKTN